MYQPKIKDRHIRRLYFLAKRERKKMTQVLNAILAEYLADEPEPPPYEPQWMRYQPSPDYAKRTERAIQKMMRDYHGGTDEQAVHRRADEAGRVVEVKIYDHQNRTRRRNLRHIPCHSPDGFEMGYEGSGPADLALAILVDYFGERPPQDGYQNPRFAQWTVNSEAWRLHQPFKRAFIAAFDDKWTLYGMQIQTWLKEQEVKDEDNGSVSAVD